MVLAIAAALTAASCDRPLPAESDARISGYEIRGLVLDRVGNGIRGAAVRMYFDEDLVDQRSGDPFGYTIQSTSELVTVAVVNRGGVTVRILDQRFFPIGILTYSWDGKDSSGTLAPSGLYHVEYRSGGTVRSRYAVVVNGGVVAQTNAAGEFTIADFNLPVGSEFPEAQNDGTYLVHRIGNRVLLVVEASDRGAEIVVELTPGSRKEVLITL